MASDTVRAGRPGRDRNLSFGHRCTQTGYGTDPVSSPAGNGQIKQPEREADHQSSVSLHGAVLS